MALIQINKTIDVPDSFFEPRIFSDEVTGSDVAAVVADVLRQVRQKGDVALKTFSFSFDKVELDSFQIDSADLDFAVESLKKENPPLYAALCRSRDLALRFARRQRKSFDDFEEELEPGLFTGQRNIPVECAGLYVPAGRFPLLSSVVMTSQPALAAGCEEVVLCTPPRPHPDGSKKPYADKGIMAAAALCGVDRVFACGGAQAIAAMAYGTESIPKCDVVVGPGNKFVAEAKRQLYGSVGIDMLAGPSEVFIIADNSANPEWVAADMLAQAEHDIDAQAILATPDSDFAEKVVKELERQISLLDIAETARCSLERNGRIIITDSLDQAALIANQKAPEHLELALNEGSNLNRISVVVRNYGSLFLGHGSAEVLGDYAAGLNHTLPTSSTARFTGGLSVRCFLKTVTTLRVEQDSQGQQASVAAAEQLGIAEGLCAHAQAARIRYKK